MADQVKERMVLEGVPKVGFYDGSDIPRILPQLPGFGITFHWRGLPLTTFVENGKTWRRNDAYIELLAASGILRLRWKEGWYQDNADMMFAAILRR